jgi:hypothetical protein
LARRLIAAKAVGIARPAITSGRRPDQRAEDREQDQQRDREADRLRLEEVLSILALNSW